MFEKNDTRGEAIFQHGNFLKYLRYFVFGPDLPSQVMDAYQDKVVACGLPFTGSDALDVTAFARGLAQSHRLNKQQAPDELYKLALDCGLDPDGARSVRDSVMKVR